MTTTIEWDTLVQAGGSIVAPAGWQNLLGLVNTIAIDSLQSVGMIFDATTDQGQRYATVGGDTRALDAPVLSTVQLRAFFSRVGAGTALPNIITVSLVPEPQPEDFAFPAPAPAPTTRLLCTQRNEVILGTFDLGTLPTSPAGGEVRTLSLDAAPIRAFVVNRARWNGRVALSFTRSTAGPGIFIHLDLAGSEDGPHLVTSQSPFFGGTIGNPGHRLRAVRDSRYAMPALNTELVRDGDNPGLWVRPWDADPEDEPARYRPRPGEGSVDDDLGSI